jgi:hypothetical protein
MDRKSKVKEPQIGIVRADKLQITADEEAPEKLASSLHAIIQAIPNVVVAGISTVRRAVIQSSQRNNSSSGRACLPPACWGGPRFCFHLHFLLVSSCPFPSTGFALIILSVFIHRLLFVSSCPFSCTGFCASLCMPTYLPGLSFSYPSCVSFLLPVSFSLRPSVNCVVVSHCMLVSCCSSSDGARNTVQSCSTL